MNYLYIVGNYYKHRDANGSCVDELIKIQKTTNDVHVLCYGEKNEDFKNDDVNIHLIEVKDYKNFIDNKAHPSFIDKIKTVITHWFSYPMFLTSIGKSFSKKANSIIELYEINAVIFVVNPIESLYALFHLSKQNKNVKKILYGLDSITNQNKRNDGFYKILFHKRIRFEKRAFSAADVIIQMNSYRDFYEKQSYRSFQSKLVFSNIPMYIPQNMPHNRDNNDHLTILYAGSLIKGIREPNCVVDLFLNLSNNINYCVSFYTRGEYQDYLNVVEINSGGKIKSMGYTDSETLGYEYERADVLISIGNLIGSMIPSKIYTYLSLKKPFIHFYFSKEDPCITIVDKCPFALLVDCCRDNVMARKAVEEFLTNLEEKRNCAFDDSYLSTNKPEYTVELIEKVSGI